VRTWVPALAPLCLPWGIGWDQLGQARSSAAERWAVTLHQMMRRVCSLKSIIGWLYSAILFFDITVLDFAALTPFAGNHRGAMGRNVMPCA
jgi:hypothetical protein